MNCGKASMVKTLFAEAPYIYHLRSNICSQNRSAVLVEFVFSFGMYSLPSLMTVPC